MKETLPTPYMCFNMESGVSNPRWMPEVHMALGCMPMVYCLREVEEWMWLVCPESVHPTGEVNP